MADKTVIACFFYLLLALVLRQTYGTYDGAAVGALACGLLLLVTSVTTPVPSQMSFPHLHSRRWDAMAIERAGWALLSIICLLLWLDPRLVIGDLPGFVPALIRSTLGISVAATLTGLLVSIVGGIELRKLAGWCAAATASGLLAARIATIGAIPEPGIDVYTTCTLACDYFAAGENPYSTEYPDVYDGRYEHDPHFFYWPAYLFWAFPFRLLFGDVRYGLVAADFVAAIFLWKTGQRLKLSDVNAALVALAWLAHPVSLLVTEAAWIDPILAMWSSISLYMVVTRRWATLGLCLGVIAGTKQYGALFSLLISVFLLARRPMVGLRVAAISSVTWLALLGPFVLWNRTAFYQSTIQYYLRGSVRVDSLSIPAWTANTIGFEIPGTVLLTAYLLIVGGICGWLFTRRRLTIHDVVGGATVAYASIFLLGRLAFCNYYYFAAFLALCYLLILLASVQKRSPTAACSAMPGG